MHPTILHIPCALSFHPLSVLHDFQPVFRKLNNKGRTASIFALLTGISMLCMFFFNVKETPAAFYTLAGITQFFFSGFNTAIYAIIPDCVEYGGVENGLKE